MSVGCEGRLQPVQVPILLPHELLHAIYQTSEALFNNAILGGCSSADFAEYWRRVQSEPWFEPHQFRDAVLDSPDKAIPLKVWGDEAPITKTNAEKMLVVEVSTVMAIQ